MSRSLLLPWPSADLSVNDKNLILSKASAELDMSSLRKTSLLLYNELINMSISLLTSAWNSNFSELPRKECSTGADTASDSLCKVTVFGVDRT